MVKMIFVFIYILLYIDLPQNTGFNYMVHTQTLDISPKLGRGKNMSWYGSVLPNNGHSVGIIQPSAGWRTKIAREVESNFLIRRND